MTYAIPASLIPNTVLTYSYLSTIANDFNILSVHDHSGSLGEGASLLYSGSSASSVSGSLSYRVECGPAGIPDNGFYSAAYPVRVGNVYAEFTGGNAAFYAKSSSFLPRGSEWGITASNRGARFWHYLYPGTYELDVYYVLATSHGSVRIQDSASNLIGTMNGSIAAGASQLTMFSTCVAVTSIPYKIEYVNNSLLSVKLSAFSLKWIAS